MAVSPDVFPPRKRRPSANSFIPPKLSNFKLIQSLLCVSKEISSLKPLCFLLKRNSSSIIRKSKLLSILFEELIRNPVSNLPHSAVLCFEEMYVVLQRILTLIEDCSNGSKMWLLVQNEIVANSFYELTVELSTLLDIFPVKVVDLNEDVKELMLLIGKQCGETKAFVDPIDENLRHRVLEMLDQIKREIVPAQSEISHIFESIGLRDSASCRSELENLEEEIQNQIDDKWRSDVIALIGLVRYAKCVLFGASTPRSDAGSKNRPATEMTFPADFRCPISLDLMLDPVIVATGQTYDRSSINVWIESGHNTCPKTGQSLAHTNLIPNRALKNLIALWCRQQKIAYQTTNIDHKINGLFSNKTALEATKMTALFLIKKLTVSESADAANRVVYELRMLAKIDSDSRACIAEAGAIPLLVTHLGSNDKNLQVNAVTTILNLSLLESNKIVIMETEGAVNGIVDVLRFGATWEAKSNAAATVFSLTAVNSCRKRLGRKTRALKGLIELARLGPTSTKSDALAAILNLAGDREMVGRLIELGVIEMVIELMEMLPEESVTILEMVVKRGGMVAITAARSLIKILSVVLREGSDRARESAAATLVSMCRRGGEDVVADLAMINGIERVLWEFLETGTLRARTKVSMLIRVLRRWASTQLQCQ